MGKSTKLGMSVHRNPGLFLSEYVDDIDNDWKHTECDSHVEERDEKG